MKDMVKQDGWRRVLFLLYEYDKNLFMIIRRYVIDGKIVLNYYDYL